MATAPKKTAAKKTAPAKTETSASLDSMSLLDKKALMAQLRQEIAKEQEATKEVRKEFRSAKKGFRNEYKIYRDLMLEFKRLSEKAGTTDEDLSRMGKLLDEISHRGTVVQ